MKVFRIKAEDERDFFKKVLLVLSGVTNLRPTAVNVLAEILYWNSKLKDVEDKDSLLLSFEFKQKMINQLNLSSANFHNQLHYLRKEGIIEDGKLNNGYNITLDDFNDILFSIEIKK